MSQEYRLFYPILLAISLKDHVNYVLLGLHIYPSYTQIEFLILCVMLGYLSGSKAWSFVFLDTSLMKQINISLRYCFAFFIKWA